MIAIINAARRCVPQVRHKIHKGFSRVFKEQAGGAEVIATLIIIAVVLVLALAFRDKLSELVKSLWNQMTTVGEESGTVSMTSW